MISKQIKSTHSRKQLSIMVSNMPQESLLFVLMLMVSCRKIGLSILLINLRNLKINLLKILHRLKRILLDGYGFSRPTESLSSFQTESPKTVDQCLGLNPIQHSVSTFLRRRLPSFANFYSKFRRSTMALRTSSLMPGTSNSSSKLSNGRYRRM